MGIEDYLDSLKPEGVEAETLSFTLDEAKALQKLSEAQLPEQSLWIVKMVQAGVSGEATEIDIKLGRNRIEVKFDSSKLPLALELFELVRSGQIPSDPFLLHLLTGIRTSFTGEGVSFLIQTVGPNGRAVVAMSEGSTYHFEDPETTLDVPVLSYVIRRPYRMLKFSKALDSSVGHFMKGTASEHLDLMTKCWASPVPIRIDGRLLDTRYDSPLMFRGDSSSLTLRRSRKNQMFVPVNVYLRYYPVEPGKPSLRCDRFDQGQRGEFQVSDTQKVFYKKPLFLDGRFLEWEYDSDRASKVLISPMGAGRDTAIFFVHDGALVQKVSTKLIPDQKVLGVAVTGGKLGGDCLIVPVEFQDLDLSQFQVRDADLRRRELLNWIMQQSLDCSDAFIEHIKHFYPVASSERKAKTALAIVGAATVPVGLGFGGMGLFAYLFYQGFFTTASLVVRSAVVSGFKSAYKKKRDELASLDLTTIEQPPIK